MREEVDPTDGNVAEVAARQHGVVSVAQLGELGMDKSAVARRLRSGRFHRVHRGVYAVGHPGLSVEGRWMAAVLACGREAVLSHAAAAALWGLLRPVPGPIDVSAPTHAGLRAKAGIRLHRCPSLADRRGTRLTTRRRLIPVTSPSRTIADLPNTVSARLVRRATREAEIRGLLRDSVIVTDRTRSDLERDFLRFCRAHRLPRPEVNIKIGRWTVDFLWHYHRLIVETDSHLYHRGSVAFEDDHRRDFQLRRLGYTVHRYTGTQLRNDPTEIAAELGEILR